MADKNDRHSLRTLWSRVCEKPWYINAIRIVIPLIIIGAAIYIYDEHIKYHVFPKRWGTVEQGLVYRSGQLYPEVLQRMIEKHNIECVLDLNLVEPDNELQQAEIRVLAEIGVPRINTPLIGDGTGEVENYILAVCAVHRAVESGSPVLVHCAAGSQRTGGVIAIYRMLVQGQDGGDVWNEATLYRFTGRDGKLKRYLAQNMNTIAHRLVEEGVIEQVPDPLPIFEKNLLAQ
ncbi:MAG: tyrosine-protein phosphatase [Phycisphaerales bacterium]|nr:tyrosine-protein phosphatase [Phycisphaerales bacterium]